MTQELHSFWTDIKKFEDILAKDPNSYCFAPLSELYRKTGLLDDAIFVAKRGIEVHPDYVGGHLALGRAYFDKGQKTDSRVVLELVVRTTPENYIAQKMLSQIYQEQDEPALAEKALEAVLALNPDDVESRLSLEALTRRGGKDATTEYCLDDEEGLEDAEIVDDDLPDADEWPGEPPVFKGDLEDRAVDTTYLDEGEPSRKVWTGAPHEDDEGLLTLEMETVATPSVSDAGNEFRDEEEPTEEAGPARDPLTTATLAEIYFAQGFHDQALAIYRELSDEEPGNDDLLSRITEIEKLKAETIANQVSPAVDAGHTRETPPETVLSELLASDPGIFPDSPAERALTALEQWLAGIERSRACR
jgi:tetratricopeptide (TPR) repeat protein